MKRRTPTARQFAFGRRLIVDWLLDDAEWWAARGKTEMAFTYFREATARIGLPYGVRMNGGRR